MADTKLSDMLTTRQGDRVRAVLNILIESPYFYQTDDRDGELFPFLLRYRREFADFFKDYYGWDLVFDQLPKAKCARVFKQKWYNNAISEGKRHWFKFTKRDECLGFMLLLEFFEQQLSEQNMSVEDRDNLRFYFSDLLNYTQKRFVELYPDFSETYTPETVRKLLRDVLPVLEQYRFLEKIKAEAGENISDNQAIYEALPAIYHYSATRLSYPISQEMSLTEDDNNE
jgi:hypothetical protein